MKKLLAVIPLVLLLAGCSAISEGTVVEKVIEPAHTFVSTNCHPVGKVTVCTPTTIYDDEDYRLDIEKDDEEGFIYVTREYFDTVEVGDYVKAD